VITICLTARCAINLQYFEQIGPLIKILGKMLINFFNFCVLYSILLVMFTLLGNYNYGRELPKYHGFLTSLFTTVDMTIGNFEFESFKEDDHSMH